MGTVHASVDRSGCETPAVDLQGEQSAAQRRQLLQGAERVQDGGRRGGGARRLAGDSFVLPARRGGAEARRSALRRGRVLRAAALGLTLAGVAAGRPRRAGCRHQCGSAVPEAGRPRRRSQQRRGTRPGPRVDGGAVQALAGGCDSRRELARLDSLTLPCVDGWFEAVRGGAATATAYGAKRAETALLPIWRLRHKRACARGEVNKV